MSTETCADCGCEYPPAPNCPTPKACSALAAAAIATGVHNHGPEEGPSLACRESIVGDCMRAELAELRRDRERLDILRAALERIAAGGCKRFVPPTRCRDEAGYTLDCEYTADRICDPCAAQMAIDAAAASTESEETAEDTAMRLGDALRKSDGTRGQTMTGTESEET